MASSSCVQPTISSDDEQDHIETDASASSLEATFTALPAEILQRILHFASTPTFLQLILVNRQLFNIAGESREVILHHLRHLPGLKLGLSDHCITTTELFLILRQRAASNLYGANFTADCMSCAFSNDVLLNSHASSLAMGTDGFPELSMVVKHDSSIHLYTKSGSYRETIESPYADGEAKIIQVVQNDGTISVLYAWTPPEKDLASRIDDHEPTFRGVSTKSILTIHHISSRRGPPSTVSMNTTSASKTARSVRYHLLHYNMYTNDRPIFFHIPTHRSLRNTLLAPAHLAVYSRILCAIVWDEPNVMRPTTRASVVLYSADRLPRGEEGIYSAFVVYPFDHPAKVFSTGVKSVLNKDRDHKTNDDDDAGEQLWTATNPKESKHDCDLRLKDTRHRPRTIAFFKDGRRLALYAPGSSVPYMTLLANEVLRQQLTPSIGAQQLLSLEPGVSSLSSVIERREQRLYHLRASASDTNATTVNGLGFQLSLPFFSRHDSMFMRTGGGTDDFCITDDLCIGTTKVPDVMVFSEQLSRFTIDVVGPPVLTIVQIRRRKSYDSCIHIETKDDLPPLPPPPRPPPPRAVIAETEPALQQTQTVPNDEHDVGHTPNVVNHGDDPDQDYQLQDEIAVVPEEIVAFPRNLAGTDLRVVARLWGWAPQSTTLTGLDTVSVSPNGQRIAVAQWDRVLIYALDPAALCEPPFDQDIAHDGSIDGTASEAGTNWGTVTDSGSDDGNNSDVGSNEIVLPPPEASTNAVDANTVSNDSDGGHDLILNNSNISANVADENEDGHTLHSTHPPLADSGNPSPEPSSTQVPEQEQPMSPTVPEPPSSTFPTLHPAASGSKSAGSLSEATSSSSTSSDGLLKFYPRTFDGFLGLKVAELRPIVLKMEGGAVVRKMVWALGRGSGESYGDSDGDDEDEEQEPGPDSEVAEYQDEGTDEVLLGEKKHGGDADGVSATDSQTEAKGIHAVQQSQDIQKNTQLQLADTNAPHQHANAGPVPSVAATAIKALPGKKGRNSALPTTAAGTSSNTKEPPAQGSEEVQSQSSIGLTPASRLQIAESELLHQIKFVKRPPEYAMALSGGDFVTNTVIGMNEAYDPPFSPSVSSTQDNGGAGKKPEIIIIDNSAATTTQDTSNSNSSGAAENEQQPNDDENDEDDEAKPANITITTERPSSPAKSHTSSTQHPVPSVVSSVTERPRPKLKRRKKVMENEIVVMTDRDVQVWDLGVWGKARRVQSEFARPPAASW